MQISKPTHFLAPLTLIVELVCGPSVFIAQSTTNKNTRLRGAEAELMQIERDIGDANVRRDKAFFQRIEANEFVFIDSGGGMTTKSEDVASLDKPVGETRLMSYVPTEMVAHVYGKTAVVTGLVTSTYKNADREFVIRSRFTDVFVKRGGRWQLVAGHSSRLKQ